MERAAMTRPQAVWVPRVSEVASATGERLTQAGIPAKRANPQRVTVATGLSRT